MGSEDLNPAGSREESRRPFWRWLLLLLLLLVLVVAWFLRSKPQDTVPDASIAEGSASPLALTAGDLADDDSVKAFIRRFIKSGELDDPTAQLSFYAETVDSYFDKPNFPKDKITSDRDAFVKKWPKRTYEIVGDPVIMSREPEQILARATFRYSVSSPTQEANDREAEAFYRIRQRGEDLEIFWVGEKVK